MNLQSQIARRSYNADLGALGMEQVIQGSINEAFIILPSLSRTATEASETQFNLRQRGVLVSVNVTAAGTGSITVSIQREDPVAGWVDMLSSVALTTGGVTTLTVYPGLTASANSVASAVLPHRWRVRAVHNNANAITYAIGASTLS